MKNLLVLFLGGVLVSACAHTQTGVQASGQVDPLVVDVAEDGYAITLPGSLWHATREAETAESAKQVTALKNSFTKGQITIGAEEVGQSFVDLAKAMHAEAKAAATTKELSDLSFVASRGNDVASYSFVTGESTETQLRTEIHVIRVDGKRDKTFFVVGSWPMRFDGVMSIHLHKVIASIR